MSTSQYVLNLISAFRFLYSLNKFLCTVPGVVTFYRWNVVAVFSIQASFGLTHLCITAIRVYTHSIQILHHEHLCLTVTSLTVQTSEHEVYFSVASSLSNKQHTVRRKCRLISVSTSYTYADHSGQHESLTVFIHIFKFLNTQRKEKQLDNNTDP
jgi:hypothetical protein